MLGQALHHRAQVKRERCGRLTLSVMRVRCSEGPFSGGPKDERDETGEESTKE